VAVHQGRTAVYRLFNAADTLIYIGIGKDPRKRWREHAKTKDWWPEVTTREIEWCETREEAEGIESGTIATKRPRYNNHPGMPGRTAGAFPNTQKRAGWTPSEELLDLFAKHNDELQAAGRTRDVIESRLVAIMRAGVTASRISKFTPWRPATMLAMAKEAGIPARVPVPGGYEGQPSPVEIETALRAIGEA
jgi:hypothetical protein